MLHLRSCSGHVFRCCSVSRISKYSPRARAILTAVVKHTRARSFLNCTRTNHPITCTNSSIERQWVSNNRPLCITMANKLRRVNGSVYIFTMDIVQRCATTMTQRNDKIGRSVSL